MGVEYVGKESHRQTRRMLADDRSRALVSSFAGQWLYLRNLDSTTPDMRRFPDFDHNLRQAFRQETELFFESVMREHRGDTVIRQLTFELPEKLPRSGTLTLAVSNPSGIEQLLGRPLARRLRSAGDVGALVRALSERQSDHRLSGVIYQPGGTVVARGLAFTELPPTAAKLLSLKATSRDRNRGPLVSPLSRAEVEMDGPVQGGGTIRLRLDRGFGTEEN